MPPTLKTARRRPKQVRALATRDAILEAATQILERHGEGAFTTNRVAERAGVSIGTLYQYFADKQAILAALARREAAALRDRTRISKARRPRDATRAAIHDLIWAFEGKPAVRRAAVIAHLTADPPKDIAAQLDGTAALFPAKDKLGFSQLDAFVVTRAVMGAVRAAVLEESPVLYEPAFEDALVRLVEANRRSKC